MGRKAGRTTDTRWLTTMSRWQSKVVGAQWSYLTRRIPIFPSLWTLLRQLTLSLGDSAISGYRWQSLASAGNERKVTKRMGLGSRRRNQLELERTTLHRRHSCLCPASFYSSRHHCKSYDVFVQIQRARPRCGPRSRWSKFQDDCNGGLNTRVLCHCDRALFKSVLFL